MSLKLAPASELRFLDFDIETRLVGFYEAGRFKPKGAEPTAIAASFIGEGEEDMYVWLAPEDNIVDMLEGFRVLYDAADVVTGHYIRKFDLPILNGAMFENHLPLLGEKLASDTKVDLKTFEGLSKSQENLDQMLRNADAKFHMNDARWRRATRLTPEGIEETRVRVTSDVLQHKLFREALVDAGALNAPTLWKP